MEVYDARWTPSRMSPKQRQVLALLATHVGQVVPTWSLTRELWEDNPPQTALTTLQTYIGQLRRVLAAAAGLPLTEITGGVLVTAARGYGLRPTAAEVDAVEFAALADRGKRAVRAGDDVEGEQLLARALRLWHGSPLVNVVTGPLTSAQVVKLTECWLSTVEHRLVARLRLGDHHSVVGELREMVALHPLHESLHRGLMLALYRCGRRAEALSVFHDLRDRLVAELGLEPSAEVTRLQRAILAADPALEMTSPLTDLPTLAAG
ncbi:MAG: AfsR/SARP family transcriptional regulator [Thermocrispum sp.]